ncbi:hypothetical protein PR048_026616 [Dryococelus australis]|uniref:DUF4817 domain-containing protein n=1 Tax=Dryococelus australis TaxID=614101 RepID=A0ABQ9GLV1_9NEOP|nr:hypothetical protein PR048_026616 [Dryococelus australis]
MAPLQGKGQCVMCLTEKKSPIKVQRHFTTKYGKQPIDIRMSTSEHTVDNIRTGLIRSPNKSVRQAPKSNITSTQSLEIACIQVSLDLSSYRNKLSQVMCLRTCFRSMPYHSYRTCSIISLFNKMSTASLGNICSGTFRRSIIQSVDWKR